MSDELTQQLITALSDRFSIEREVALSPTSVVRARDTVVRSGLDILPRNGHATYDVAADGRLLLVRRLSASTPPVVAIGWFNQALAGLAT